MRRDISIILLIVVILFVVSPFSLVLIQGDSMSPTIPNDAVLLTQETQSATTGDIITFQSQTSNTQITHRIVGETSNGFITKGDNNEVTDQQTGEPPVPATNIQNKAITISGQPLYIPIVGQFLLLIRLNFFSTTVLFSVLIMLIYFISNRVEENRIFGHLVAADIFQPIILVTIVVLTLSIFITASTLTATITYTDSKAVAEQQYVVQTGGNESQLETITIEHSNPKYSTFVFDSTGIEITNVEETSPRTTQLEVLVPPKEQTGTLETTITIYKFPALLPNQLLTNLTNISPVIPAVLLSILTVSPFYLWYRFIIGPNTPIHSLPGSKLYQRFKY